MEDKINFINAKQFKQYLKEKGAYAVSPEVIDKVNDILKEVADNAYSRSNKNQRTTVMERDL